jgi:hypothetical protein
MKPPPLGRYGRQQGRLAVESPGGRFDERPAEALHLADLVNHIQVNVVWRLAQLGGDGLAVGHGPKGQVKPTYYACGWDVRPAVRQPGKYTKWHGGLLAGSSTLLVCRDDGINWAVLFNSDAGKDRKEVAGLIDPLLHKPASEIKDWPKIDLFPRF